MNKTIKPKIAGIFNIISGSILAMGSFGSCMEVINVGKLGMAWFILLIVPGILALIGGIYALDRKRWSFALVGAICAIPCGLGIISIILLSMSKTEFN